MNELKFLSFEDVQEIHEDVLREFGGTWGIRDRSSLESASFHPQKEFFYGHGDLFDIAAAYAFHIAEAQAFLDGIKRAAIGAVLTFLEGNVVITDADPMLIYQAMIAIVEKRMSKHELAALFRRLFQT